VEDEEPTLKLVEKMLLSVGYRTITANTVSDARKIVASNDGNISLLITDVIMPKMNGKELCKDIKSRYPNIKCLFLSGYTADIISSHGILEEGYHFIQKPFSRKDLAIKVREILDIL
jgi:DNA-binding NtrC family response regulator